VAPQLEILSEETFAREEARLGKRVHFHDGVWWVNSAPFYCKPVHEFLVSARGRVKPRMTNSLLGYSRQVSEPTEANRIVHWHVVGRTVLDEFSIDSLKSATRRAVRRGSRDCEVRVFDPTEKVLEEMRIINRSQAERFEGVRINGTFFPPSYYDDQVGNWRKSMLGLFQHPGHQFIGAFVDEMLVAYIDLLRVEDVWQICAVKSRADFLGRRPVDLLYFSLLTMAAESPSCRILLNGGAEGEPETLRRFKEKYLLEVVSIPYFTRTVVPVRALRALRGLLRGGR